MAFYLRGDVWTFRFRKIYGKVELFCSSTDQSCLPNPPGNEIPRFNILDAIEHLPQNMRASLTPHEVEELGYLFLQGYAALTRMEVSSGLSFVREAMSDHDAAVQFLTASQHFGQSKWASLQATEKILKAYIALTNGPAKRIHGLEKLAVTGEQLGLARISRQQLSLIQCEAGVRYGEIAVDCTDALAAHHASLSVSGEVALHIMRYRGITDDTITGLNVRRAF